ncbi:hypothetical protein DFH06DRAFT_1308607 [Mycena polygramma]|nr:hypothetical protein DFH06DRAFT_1308607 [Mycena polygramma]
MDVNGKSERRQEKMRCCLRRFVWTSHLTIQIRTARSWAGREEVDREPGEQKPNSSLQSPDYEPQSIPLPWRLFDSGVRKNILPDRMNAVWMVEMELGTHRIATAPGAWFMVASPGKQDGPNRSRVASTHRLLVHDHHRKNCPLYMHRCLDIREILEAICINLDPALIGDSGRALARLARTSTPMSDPALNILWKTQQELVNFFELFPDDLFTPSPRRWDHARFWRLARPIMATDLERPLLYASRVRVLAIGYYNADRFLEILLPLSSCWPGGFLFPNLRRLEWIPARGPTFVPIRIFCPPGLTWIRLSFHVVNATSAFICGLQNVETLHTDLPTIDALRHIAQLPSLTALEITGLPSSLWGSTPLSPPIFGHLRRLVLGPLEIELARDFISSLVISPLVSLHITLNKCITAAQTSLLFDTLRVTCSQFLCSFTLQNTAAHFPAAGRENYRINSHSLGILSCLGGLTTLSIMSPVGFDLDDAAIDTLAAAWPLLEDLTLETTIMSAPIYLTFRALRSLALHCPFLNSLDIEFDAASSPPSSAEERVVQDTLEILRVGSSPISKPGRVARYLSRLFPNLSAICTVREDEDNEDEDQVEQNGQAIAWHRLWKQVQEDVPEYVETRREGHSMQT